MIYLAILFTKRDVDKKEKKRIIKTWIFFFCATKQRWYCNWKSSCHRCLKFTCISVRQRHELMEIHQIWLWFMIYGNLLMKIYQPVNSSWTHIRSHIQFNIHTQTHTVWIVGSRIKRMCHVIWLRYENLTNKCSFKIGFQHIIQMVENQKLQFLIGDAWKMCI